MGNFPAASCAGVIFRVGTLSCFCWRHFSEESGRFPGNSCQEGYLFGRGGQFFEGSFLGDNVWGEF